MTKGRRLGGMERLFYQQNSVGSSNLCSILFYEGALDLETLPAALARVQAAYPLLTSKTVADPKLRFEEQTGPIPFRVLERTSADQWRLLVREEVRRRYREDRIFVTILQGPVGGEIIVAADHSLTDAKSLYAVCECFIAAWKGRETALVPTGDAWEERLPREYRGWCGFFKIFRFVRKLFRISPERSVRFGLDTESFHTETFGFSLDKSALNNLKIQADRQQCNLNALFCAASMLAAFDLFCDAPEGIVSLNTPVSLRDQIHPPASAAELGLFISGLLQWHALRQTTDIWDLSRNILLTIRNGVKAGEPILLGKLAKGPKRPGPLKVDKNRKRFEHSLTVSNPGRLTSFEDLPKARIVGYRTLGSLWTQESIVVVVLGYGDQLFVDVEVSIERLGHIPQRAERLAEGIRQRVMALVSPS